MKDALVSVTSPGDWIPSLLNLFLLKVFHNPSVPASSSFVPISSFSLSPLVDLRPVALSIYEMASSSLPKRDGCGGQHITSSVFKRVISCRDSFFVVVLDDEYIPKYSMYGIFTYIDIYCEIPSGALDVDCERLDLYISAGPRKQWP